MSENKVQLNLSALLNVPFAMYPNDFTFIVNQKEYKTSYLISELLSPKICRMHTEDPTIDSFIIDTDSKGNFGKILELINFKEKEISSEELPFFLEVFEKLDNESIKLIEFNSQRELTKDNIFKEIQKHEKYQRFYQESFQREIEFISSHFYEIVKEQEGELMSLDELTIKSILENDKLLLENEDQILKFINHMYKRESKYAYLYENVLFCNVSNESINEFLETFNIYDVTSSVWSSISNRLKQPIQLSSNQNESPRYIVKTKSFLYDQNRDFSGIINFLKSRSDGKIENEINITATELESVDGVDKPQIVTEFEEHENKSYISKNSANSFICFEFKKCKVNLTKYTIRARKLYNCHYPKSWIIEGSNGNDKWDKLDERTKCDIFNQSNIVHTFDIQNKSQNYYKYIRIKQTGPNSSGGNYFIINAFEIYGVII